MPSTPSPPSGPDFDPDALRAKYRAERDRRLRPDGSAQYQRAEGDFGYYADDPYATADFTRERCRTRSTRWSSAAASAGCSPRPACARPASTASG
jgi:hypothetical protein